MRIASRPLGRLGGSRRVTLAGAAALGALAFAIVPAQGALAAPNGMHYELVSPADVGGTVAVPGRQTADGARVSVSATNGQGFGGTPSWYEIENALISKRTPTGWTTIPMNVPASPEGRSAQSLNYSTDLTTVLSRNASIAQYHAGQTQFDLTGIDGSYLPTSPALTDLTGKAKDETPSFIHTYVGSTPELSHAVFDTSYQFRLLPGDSASSPGTIDYRLYEMVGVGTSSATLRRVDLTEAGTELGGPCGAIFGGYNSDGAGNAEPNVVNVVSADGSKVFFSGRPTATVLGTACNRATYPLKVFARVDGQHTVELSATECVRVGCSTSSGNATYQGASRDGSRVAFRSNDQLADSDVDSTSDLYIYDFTKTAGHHLTQASIGDATNATPGAGATVRGITKLSDDGSRVYFVAGGVLTTNPNSAGQTALGGANNLYLYEPGTNKTSFIGRLDAADSGLWGITVNQKTAELSDAAGDVLVFTSKAQLVASDTDTARDVYRYDAVTNQLEKVSPGSTADDATTPNTESSTQFKVFPGHISSDGSRIVFWTVASLSPDDVNGKGDVYLWKNGDVELVSDGQDSAGVGTFSYSIDADGNQIAFDTSRRLVPEDVDDVISAYVARTGDDIVRQPDVTPHCTGDPCQGPDTPAPFTWTPAPPADGGAGNVPLTEPTLRVAKVTATGIAQLVKSGSTKLSVTVSEGGAIVATARGEIDKRAAVLGTAKASPTKGGVTSLTLKLTKAARSELAAKGRLSVKLSVTFSKVAPVYTQTLSLKKAKAKAKAKTKAKKSKAKKSKAKSIKRNSGR